jgi:hypothetical protein
MRGTHRRLPLWGAFPFAGAVRLGAVFAAGLLLTGCTVTDLFGGDGIRSADSGAATAVIATEPVVQSELLQVETLSVQVLESFPVQVNAVVRGTLPDSCTEVGQISQERSGNAITVTIPTTRDPLALCAQALVPVEVTVALDGDFPSGEYTVTVNGVTVSFRV